MKGMVIHNTETDEYASFAHSDCPEITSVPIEQATVFWPEVVAMMDTDELLECAADFMDTDISKMKLKEVEVTIV